MAGPSRQRWTTILCFALLTAVTTVFFYRLVFHPGNTLTSFDIVAAQSEYKFVQWHSFSDWGRFPLWDPTVFCGKSIVGDSLPAVLAIAISAKERKDDVKLGQAMAKLIDEDPSLVVIHNPETHEVVVWGQGEMHLRVVTERLAERYGLLSDGHNYA